MSKGEFLGEFEIYVLLALVHLREDAYGVKIRQEIDRGLPVVSATRAVCLLDERADLT